MAELQPMQFADWPTKNRAKMDEIINTYSGSGARARNLQPETSSLFKEENSEGQN